MDSYVALEAERRRQHQDDQPLTAPPGQTTLVQPKTLHSLATSSTTNEASHTAMLPSPSSAGDTTAWEQTRLPDSSPLPPSPPSASSAPSELLHRAGSALSAVTASLVSHVESLASEHQRYQKQSELPNQRTPVVHDVVKEKEKEQMQQQQQMDSQTAAAADRSLAAEADREYEATVL
jgi:hypothetical protein